MGRVGLTGWDADTDATRNVKDVTSQRETFTFSPETVQSDDVSDVTSSMTTLAVVLNVAASCNANVTWEKPSSTSWKQIQNSSTGSGFGQLSAYL